MSYYQTRNYRAARIRRSSSKSQGHQNFGVAFSIEHGVKTVVKSFWDVWSTPTELTKR